MKKAYRNYENVKKTKNKTTNKKTNKKALWEFQKKTQKVGHGTESIFKAIMAENFPNTGREMDIHIHEA